MQSMIGESVQKMLLPGECVDTYYAGVSNTEKQCFPAKVQNKFYVDLNSKTPGSSSTVTFNPNQGVTDIMLELQLPDLSGVFVSNGLALQPGWGYRAIANISYRYATASQWFVESAQHFISVIDSVEDFVKRDTLIQLGGQALVSAADFADPVKRTAYVYIKIPSNTPNHKKHLPYPSDLTTQPLQLTIQLEDWARLFRIGAGSIASNLQLYNVARVNFRQVELDNSNDLLAKRVDMTEKIAVYPLDRYEQRQVSIGLDNTGNQQSVQLTGFRSGQISHIVLFAVNKDLASGNGLLFSELSNVVLTINGDVRYDARDGASVFWDTVTNPLPSIFNTSLVASTGANNGSASTASSYYVKIPLGQEASKMNHGYELTDGYSIMNSVLNLQVQVPANTNGYTLFAAYWYRSALTFANGNVDFVF